MPVNRIAVRNVRICSGTTGASLGGMQQNGSITEAVSLWILNRILLIATKPFNVRKGTSGHITLPTSNLLEPRTYDVYCDGKDPQDI